MRSPAAADGEWIAQASPGSSQEDAFLPRIFSEDGAKSRQLDSATKTDCAPAKTLLDWLSIQLLVEPEYYTDCLALLKEGLEKHPHVDPENFIEFLESQHPGLKLPALAGGLTGIVSLLLWHETLRALARADATVGTGPSLNDFKTAAAAARQTDRLVVTTDETGRTSVLRLDAQTDKTGAEERLINRQTTRAFIQALGGEDPSWHLMITCLTPDWTLTGEIALDCDEVLTKCDMIKHLEACRDALIADLLSLLDAGFLCTDLYCCPDTLRWQIQDFDRKAYGFGLQSFIRKLKTCYPALVLPPHVDSRAIIDAVLRDRKLIGAPSREE